MKCSQNCFAALPLVISVKFLRLEKLQGLPGLPWGHRLLLHCPPAGKVEWGALQRARLRARGRSESCLHLLLRWVSSQADGDQKLSPAAASPHTHTHRKANRISHFIRNQSWLPLHFDFPLFSPCSMTSKWLSISLSRNSVFFICHVTKALLLGFRHPSAKQKEATSRDQQLQDLHPLL